jgi:PhnB protein
MKMNPYLNFDGQAEEAFEFYRSVFGGEFMGGIMRMGDAPGMEKIPADEKNRVMHVALPISSEVTLMASDTLPSMGHQLKPGNSVQLSLHPESKEEADRLFQALSRDGKVEMGMHDSFWGAYFGSFTDKFGINWMINYEKPHSS